MSTNTGKKRGRPSIGLNWPTESTFTVKDITDGQGTVKSGQAGTSLTGAAVRLKIRQALSTGELERAGKEKGKMGRPRWIFKKPSKCESKLP